MSNYTSRLPGWGLFLGCALLLGCGVPERDNPLDPASGRGGDIAELLIGTWNRADAEKNEVYVFKRNGGFELHSYSAPGGGEVDRNAPYPQTLRITYFGTYALVGNLLRLSFSGVQTNQPGGVLPALPPADKVVTIAVARDTLIFREPDGDRLYTRL